ncbi:cyanophycinase [Dyadobacter fermentans]|uniref:Cyanophycinase n=1 Tax=Dyadobacter fermentans (strain ATCC 700827 / DSM 18053 / CIP 107007 / KCTC 52180 / NS114) TaxID=471854 RepID=C6VZG9_DYAFD|nr:cyanophycinase [Dyadobacter fermentans]ACT91781.1 cyanophycinase [Dyadobacter fermentans DSM 18053]
MSRTDIKSPHGKLIAIGGKEARSSEEGMLAGSTREPAHDSGSILTHVLAEIKGPASRIEILTTASEQRSEMADMYTEAFRKLGCEQVGILDLDGRNVDSKETLQRLAAADGLFMTGGDQTRLIEKIGGSEFLKNLKRRYQQDDFTIIGTSAGAMAMSEVMINEGDSTESLLKGIVSLSRGFNFLPKTVIDTHFMSRGRFSRLAEALLMHKGMTALGICEDTALVVGDGGIARAIGSGIVMVLEAEKVRSTNFKEAKKGEAIYVEGMQIHILASGAMYSLPEKKFLLSTQPQ